MKAPELSQELKGDLQVLKMRGSLDPKRFYKKNDRDGFPKYFQVSMKMNHLLIKISLNIFLNTFRSGLYIKILAWCRLVPWWTTQWTFIIPESPRRTGREQWWRSYSLMPSLDSKSGVSGITWSEEDENVS